ncbi:General secretion pathway protein J [Thioalkalivibrio nitratireducens DSM 14787]|uniref:General secretion pathway protein J n=1 Tax=Thioalkalivibrio nitratireducens (strain DSM 14787 / UNIQEM 213 / ALEN2) TaxID=1255043 RepID=L0DX87_THIND|nr:General secretion pathway protein J [Thioalkalivibrio nitratireducens DSM 14787]
MRWRSGPARGFTLLEVMIALVLLGLLLSLLFSGLRLGAGSWDAAERAGREVADRMQVLEFIDRSLARAEPVFRQTADQGPVLVFEGRPDGVDWVAALPGHRGGGGLYRLSLEVAGAGTAEAALVLGQRLFHPDTLAATQTDRETLADGVQEIALEYFGTQAHGREPNWTDHWRADRLPRLVRMRIRDREGEWPPLIVAPRQDYGAQIWITEPRP